jgi:hypothetical protein
VESLKHFREVVGSTGKQKRKDTHTHTHTYIFIYLFNNKNNKDEQRFSSYIRMCYGIGKCLKREKVGILETYCVLIQAENG